MKKIIYTFIITLLFIFSSGLSYAGTFKFEGESKVGDSVEKKIEAVSTTLVSENTDLADNIEENGINILKAIKGVAGGVLIIFMVYIGVMMVMSMGSDEEQLSSAKRQLRYALIAFVFINIPGSIFTSFHKESSSTTTIDQRMGADSFTSKAQGSNILINEDVFVYTVNENIVLFIKVIIGFIAVAVIIFAGLKILTARGREDQVTEAKGKIIYSIAALVFVGIAEVWKNVAFSGNINDGKNLFEQLGNLALYFAGPVGIFFLMLAGYYMITSNGDEERVKKAKSIVINTVIATIILLASYTFLLDLADLGS